MKWKTDKLGNHCEITSSKRIFYSEYVPDGVPFFRSKEIIELSDGKNISEPLFISETRYNELKLKFGVPIEGDLLLTSVGTIGIPYIVKKDDIFYFKDGNLTWFRNFNTKLASRFLNYWIQSENGRGTLYNTTIGSSQKALTISALQNIEIPIPPINTQHKIADVLSSYDDLIENNQKQIKLLEEAAQRLYKEWFVDLRFPGHEKTPIVDGVPEGWERKKIADVCQTIGGGTPNTKITEYYNGKIYWVTPTDITSTKNLFLLDTEKKITEEGLLHSSARMLPPYTILMTSRASVGYFGLCEQEVCTNQGFISCVPNEDVLRYYLLGNLRSRVDEIRGLAGGTTYLEISKSKFREMDICLPSDKILQEFHKQMVEIINLLKTKTLQISNLQEARDRLLPKLMSGEIEV